MSSSGKWQKLFFCVFVGFGGSDFASSLFETFVVDVAEGIDVIDVDAIVDSDIVDVASAADAPSAYNVIKLSRSVIYVSA
jgi:hypothetical protein